MREGRPHRLEELLATDVAFTGDGGGKVAVAVRQPVHGSERVARLLHGILFRRKHLGIRVQPAQVNGQPGAMVLDSQARVIFVFALDIADDAVQAIRSVINPDKLRHLGRLSDWAVGGQPTSR